MIRIAAAIERRGEPDLFRSAEAGLGGLTPGVLQAGLFDPEPLRWSIIKLVLVLVVVAALTAGVFASVRSADASPGAPRLDELISVDGTRGRWPGTMFMTTVPVLGATDVETREGLRHMEVSKRNARAAVVGCLALNTGAAGDIDIRSRKIEGPSAGLMFALGIVDTLESGAVSRGRQIAGTGTIRADGRVGSVGSVEQKVSAAESVGAEIFLAPASQVDDARLAAIDVDVIGVHSLDEAIRILGGRGCSSGTAS